MPDDFIAVTPPPPTGSHQTNLADDKGAAQGVPGPTGASGATGGHGTKPSTGASANKNAASGRGTGALPKNPAGTGASTGAYNLGSVPAPTATPPASSDDMLQISPAMLQQLLASAVAASSSNHREPPVPKFWESESAAWFQVFRSHYQPRNLSQVALFNALLPLVPASAVALCRPFVGSAARDVFDQVERLLLKPFEMSPMERGKALVECTSLGDRTPEEMLQHMRSLQPGEEEGVIFRYLFVSLLPDGVREVVANLDSLDDVARTANTIMQSNASARISDICIYSCNIL